MTKYKHNKESPMSQGPVKAKYEASKPKRKKK